MKERFSEAPKPAPMFMDESLYSLHVEEARHEGAKRERKGVLMAMKRFLDTPKGKYLGMTILGAGMSANGVLGYEYFTRTRATVDSFEEAPLSPDSFAGDRPLEEVRADLNAWIGADRVAEMIPMERNDRERSARERRREEIRHESVAAVEGFADLGISHESITSYLEEGFPRFMTAEGNVESIRFTPEHRAVREDYHLSAGRETAGTCSIAAGADESEITIFGAMLDERGHLRVQDTFRQVLPHELAHSVDWTNLEALDPATRLRMLHQMASHVRNSETRLFFSYVEEIQNDDARTELVNRIIEYYAEFTQAVFENAPISDMDSAEWEVTTVAKLVEEYARRPEMSEKETARLNRAVLDDVRLVREVIQAYEPDFDWRAAASARRDLVLEMSRDMENRQIHMRIAGVPLESARHLLEDAMERSMETPSAPTFQDVAWQAGTGETYFTSAYDRGLMTAAAYERGRELEREIDMAQRTAVREIESGLSVVDAPAYRHLIAILETLEGFDPTLDQTIERVLDVQIRDYVSVLKMASPEHVDAARRFHETMTGVRGIDSDVARRVEVLLAEEAD